MLAPRMKSLVQSWTEFPSKRWAFIYIYKKCPILLQTYGSTIESVWETDHQ